MRAVAAKGAGLCAALACLLGAAPPASAQDSPGAIEGLPAQAPRASTGAVVHWPSQVPADDTGLVDVPLPSASGQMRFMIDPASVSRPAIDLVRYTLVARSRSGYRNISYEGLNCADNTWHIYATWDAGAKRWVPNGDKAWIRANVVSNSDVHGVLDRNYWCKGAMAAGDPGELMRRLRSGLQPYFVAH
jgi:hypothetical protein